MSKDRKHISNLVSIQFTNETNLDKVKNKKEYLEWLEEKALNKQFYIDSRLFKQSAKI